MHPKTPAGRPESGPSDPFDFEGDELAAGPGEREGVRLNKFLAQNGVASRRGADALIASGHVTVDGKLVTELGRRVDPARETVEVDGVVLRPAGERLAYYLLNKPRGVVCTNDPREARPRAVDLIDDERKGRIYTVGRLDEDTEGLVILTNDGEFANRISHPRYGVKKTYWVDVRGRVADESIAAMQKGVRLSDGWGSFERVKVLKRHAERSILLVTLSEGKNREVRRVLAALDLPVRNLRRVEIGPLRDRRLKLGQWRTLTRSEVGELLGATRPGAGRVLHPRRRSQGSATPGYGNGSRRPWSRRPPRRHDEHGPSARGPGRGGRAGGREQRG
jgi:23S rRNA pseudouridine2605 synthase